MTPWDTKLLNLAAHVASWSKDPSTKVGAVIADDLHRVRGIGFNGFARNIADTFTRLADRELKIAMTIHAEANALLNATSSVEHCTLYVHPLPPCSACASLIVQRGIRRVVAPRLEGPRSERWTKSCDLAAEVFAEAGVELDLVPAISAS